jgi:CRP-like cAMP-binding protein
VAAAWSPGGPDPPERRGRGGASSHTRCTAFAGLNRVVLEQLARGARIVSLPAGSVIVAQGGSGEDFFVVDSGSLEVQVDGSAVRDLGPSDCFGEIAALRKTPRTASIVTRTTSRLLRLDGEDFVYAVTGHRLAERAALELARERIAFRVPAEGS